MEVGDVEEVMRRGGGMEGGGRASTASRPVANAND